MPGPRIACLALAAASLVLISSDEPTRAQTAPRAITIVSATAAGGPGDTAARIIAEHMAPVLGQTIVVENVPGAGGNIAAARVARAAPDGATLLVHQTGITIAPALSANLPYDLLKDLSVVGMVNVSSSLVVGRKSLPADDWAGLKDWMRGPGRPAKIAHAGVGSLGHINALLLGRAMAAEVAPIAYRGTGPILNDIVGGHVDLVFAGTINSLHLIKSGAMKAFAFVGHQRLPQLPQIPTLLEVGAADVFNRLWHALFVPAGTSRPAIERLNAALRAALGSPALQKVYADGGVENFPPEQLTIEGATRFVVGELERWRRVAGTLELSR